MKTLFIATIVVIFTTTAFAQIIDLGSGSAVAPTTTVSTDTTDLELANKVDSINVVLDSLDQTRSAKATKGVAKPKTYTIIAGTDTIKAHRGDTISFSSVAGDSLVALDSVLIKGKWEYKFKSNDKIFFAQKVVKYQKNKEGGFDTEIILGDPKNEFMEGHIPVGIFFTIIMTGILISLLIFKTLPKRA